MGDAIEPVSAVDWRRTWQPPQSQPVAVAPTAASAPAPATVATELPAAVAMINADLAGRDTVLRFQMDDILNRVIVSVIDESTGDVVRQLPPEEVLSVARRLAAGDARLLDTIA